MKLGIMQPYAFPYLGYFQLINAVDLFVLYDDVAFEKQSWINRNALGARQGRQNFTLPVHKPRLGQPISEMRLSEPKINQRKLLRTIDVLYRRAPHYKQVMPVLESAIVHDDENLARYLRHSLDVVTAYLGVSTPLVRSSERHRQIALQGQERVIDICRTEGAQIYINAEGGRQLYDEAKFRRHGIDLRFLLHEPRPYRQTCMCFGVQF